MAEIATIARPYAEAAFDLADQAGSLQDWSATLGNLAQAASDPDALRVIGDPQVSDAQRVDMLMSVAGGADAQMRNFLVALAENKRLAALPAIRDRFEQLKAERETIVDARVESAFALDAGQLAGLVSDLERRFRKKVRAQLVVDAGLIGGARITVGDLVIDGSVRGKLAAMAAGLGSE